LIFVLAVSSSNTNNFTLLPSYLCISLFPGQVVLPEGSKDIDVSAPFPIKQWQEVDPQ
jgi:hypothetical protein